MFDASTTPNLLVGLDVADDAAVYRLDAETAVVATLDFFSPIVDDPGDYGAIAAANAMSDIYAMGGEVVLALNIAAFPEDLPYEVAAAIIGGAAAKVAEAGGVVAGGHTVWDPEPKFGLSVLGLVHPDRILTKAALEPGDILYLTKPLGTGLIVSAARQGKADPGWVTGATASMARLNRHASHLARGANLKAATDVTGFGLLGHLWEMAERSNVRVSVDSGLVPLLEGAIECSRMDVHTGGEGRNREWAGGHVSFAPDIDPAIAALLFDPQTSGGLLIGCPANEAAAFEAAFMHDGEPLWPVGSVEAGPPAILAI
jgi:selenide,water dikinase